MTDKSGIDMLEEILDQLKTLEKRLNVMDNNIKAIVNSTNLANLIQKASNTPLDSWANASKPILPDVEKKIADIKKKSGFKNFNFESVDAAKIKGSTLIDKSRIPISKIMVKGRLKIDKDGKVVPLSSAVVKIYDEKDKLIKSTKTNKAGHWMSQLSPGKYVALFEGEVDGKKLLPQNKNFEVPDKLPKGQVELEII